MKIISSVTCFDLVASSGRGSGCITVLTFRYNGVISISKQKICRYGLILPKKAQQLHPVLQKPSVFGNDSDDDDEVRETFSTALLELFLFLN